MDNKKVASELLRLAKDLVSFDVKKFKNFTGTLEIGKRNKVRVKNATFSVEGIDTLRPYVVWKKGTWVKGKWFDGVWVSGDWLEKTTHPDDR